MTTYDPKDIDQDDVRYNSKFKDIDLEMVKKLAEYGHTDIFMVDFFGVNDKTWTRWKLKHPKFAEALKAWRTKANERVEKAIYEKAVGYQHREEKVHFDKEGMVSTHITIKQHPPSEGAAMMWLKNKDKENWKDKQDLEVHGDDLASAISRARKRVQPEIEDNEDFLK